ncbi:hypothetical protein [Sphingomonas sp. SUN039]|uniref:hypothetical protein n=1 Tax=Sphingomonas sp. SUN039 TaxID=2937787 RepID=UPI0021642FE5|nr:hypothetical protein [Sphingomonas sp. SUN039]UVO52584.1 hypothetical protein M0209_00010 [Sphingomonas sp. SUN039]
MTLEDINYVAQSVGVVAILGTFVALLVQMRQTNRLLRNQAKRALIDGTRMISETVYQTPGLAELLVRAMAGGLDGLSPPERLQIMSFLMTAERIWEAMFVQYQEGMIDEELWKAHSRQTQAAFNDNAAMREFWALRREFFMPAYSAFRDAQIADKGGSDSLGYGAKPAPTKDAAPPPAAAPGSDGAAA